ncbi:tRNA (adenosine(37)-N6)-threonylcarbamoyltransferase complex ATPase subunit type 1 TsaE [Candidatus Ruminimicrobium bovinum]|uniref:tRNA (adenosine(37)-N6)-threonylcarbamoyltransferase complex ATPase subunit type 1 TsaE n=1 Tax=Candidatus Ruminimicrobium bovinum TaxID=3242779 RepID=UPI0039B9A8C3
MKTENKNKLKLTDLNTFNNKTFVTKSYVQTKELAKEFAKVLKPKDIVLFNGDLGAGKTTFIQGIMAYFGIKKFVRSASFMLVSEFKAKDINLYHLDLYRLNTADIFGLGLEEYLFGNGISFVEWSQRLPDNSIKKYWQVNLEYIDDNTRKIKIRKH